MAIKEGDIVPDATIKVMGDEGPENISTLDLFGKKNAVLFAVPGAFTPGCSLTHLPGFVVNADKIKEKNIDIIACISVNDAFVMKAWGQSQNADEIIMLADGNAEFTKKIGLTLDGSNFGMGIRSQRYAMIIRNGVIDTLLVEEGGGVKISSAESILNIL